MDETRFWSMIEDAWRDVHGAAAARRKLAQGTLDEERAMELTDQSLDEFVPALRASLEQLTKDELLLICSPFFDPRVMRVFGPLKGKEILDEFESQEASFAGTDHRASA